MKNVRGLKSLTILKQNKLHKAFFQQRSLAYILIVNTKVNVMGLLPLKEAECREINKIDFVLNSLGAKKVFLRIEILEKLFPQKWEDLL